MNWHGLLKYYEKEYEFFTKIRVNCSDGTQAESIHPLIKLSTAISLKTIFSSGNNKLVLLFPRRNESARWLALLSILGIMKHEFNRNPSPITRFSKKQKLLISNCVVEYIGEITNNGKRYMRVMCRPEARVPKSIYEIPLDKKLVFQPANTKKRLSPMKRVIEAYKTAEELDDELDIILGINTHGNLTYFKDSLILISGIRDTEVFLNENRINKTKPLDLFQWGKLDDQGEFLIINPDKIEASPSGMVSSKLFGACNYISHHPDMTKGVIIDGSLNYVNNLQLLDDILDKKIATIIVADSFDTCNLQCLIDRDFSVWQWNKKSIIESRSIIKSKITSPFLSINDSLSNYSNQKIKDESCEYSELSKVVQEILKLDKVNFNDSILKASYSKLFQVVNDFSRLIAFPSRFSLRNFEDTLLRLHDQFTNRHLWLTNDVLKSINAIFETLSELIKNRSIGEKHKISKIGDLISDNSGRDLLFIVVSTESDVQSSKEYWESKFPPDKLRRVYFLSISQCLNRDRSIAQPHVVVSGWFGKDKMFKLLHSYVFTKITLVLYNFEYDWFQFAQRRWIKQNNFQIRAKDFSRMLGINESELNFIDFKAEEPVEPKKDALDIFNFELKIINYRYSPYISPDHPIDEVSKARLIIFPGNKFSHITESHHLYVATDLITGNASHKEIPRKNIDELKIGDYVLFRDSDKDIIREIADRGLQAKGLSHLRKLAGTWKEALQIELDRCNNDIDRLIEFLRNAGCKRQPNTIKNWLDDHLIAPKSDKDLQVIADSTKNSFFKENFSEVKNAISQVRGAHLQASSYLINKLLSTLPHLIERKEDHHREDNEGSILMDLDDFGRIEILRIVEISDEWEEIDTKQVNRLFTLKDE